MKNCINCVKCGSEVKKEKEFQLTKTGELIYRGKCGVCGEMNYWEKLSIKR